VTYVEWLRVWRVLKVTAIVLVALEILLVVVRISLLAIGPHDSLSFVHGVEVEPSSHVTHVTLPDGTNRTVIDSAKDGVHIIVDDRGYQGKRVQIVEIGKHRSERFSHTVAMGDLNVETQPSGNETVTTIDTGKPEDLVYYFVIATVIGLIIATVLGAPFARENEGHLEIALTKPIAREPLAIATIGADLAGVLAAFVMTILFLVVGHTIFEVPHYVFGPYDGYALAIGLVGCAAWYGLLCAATASMRRGYGAIVGFAWPIAALVAFVGKINLSGTQIGQIVHAIFTPLAWIDPFTYLHVNTAVMVNGSPAGSAAANSGFDLSMLAILTVVYLALAVLQWRRVEA
jgi:hypothetical protein